MAYIGFNALSISGFSRIFENPSTKSIENQIIIAGPNTYPTVFVPKRWKKNKPEMMTMTIGTV
jgi:hypothetical protein